MESYLLLDYFIDSSMVINFANSNRMLQTGNKIDFRFLLRQVYSRGWEIHLTKFQIMQRWWNLGGSSGLYDFSFKLNIKMMPFSHSVTKGEVRSQHVPLQKVQSHASEAKTCWILVATYPAYDYFLQTHYQVKNTSAGIFVGLKKREFIWHFCLAALIFWPYFLTDAIEIEFVLQMC